MKRLGVSEFLRSGLRITTALNDGSLGAEFVLQPDGDVVNRVSRAFLNDAAAQRRHAECVREALAPLHRLRMVVRSFVPVAGTTVTVWLALQHHVVPTALSLGTLALVAVQRLRRARARKAI